MVVRNTIQEFIDRRGITVYQFWKETGIAQATAYRIYKNPNDIPTGAVLNAICKAYEIQPGDLLRYEPDAESEENQE